MLGTLLFSKGRTLSEKSLDMSKPTFHAKKKKHVTDCNSKPKCMANYFQKLYKKHSIRAAAHRISLFYWALHHQIAECTWACPPTPFGVRLLLTWYDLIFHSSLSQLNRTHPLKGRSAILGELQDNCFVSVVCGCGPLANHTYTITKTGMVCLFDAKRLLDRFTETKVSNLIPRPP